MNKIPIMLNTKSPNTISDGTVQLIRHLNLNKNDIHLLPYKKEPSFDAEINSCHLNVWVKCRFAGGKPICGWLIGEDPEKKFTEGVFHCVWESPDGEISDITPRADEEDQIMFISDRTRVIALSELNKKPALISYDNVRIMNGRVLTPLSKIKFEVKSDMLLKYGLIKQNF